MTQVGGKRSFEPDETMAHRAKKQRTEQRTDTDIGTVTLGAFTLEDKEIGKIGQLYKGVMTGTLHLPHEKHEEVQKRVLHIFHEAKHTEIDDFTNIGVDKGVFISQVRGILDFLGEGPQRRALPENFLRDDADAVNIVISLIVEEKASGTPPDQIASKLALSPEEKKAVVFQFKHLQREKKLSKDDVALFSSVLGVSGRNYASKTDDFLYKLLSHPPEEVMKKWKGTPTVEALKARVDDLGFQHIAQFQTLYTKIDQLATLTSEIEKAYAPVAGEEQQYTKKQIARIAAAILFEVPGTEEEGKIKVDIGQKKLQTLFYDKETGDVYVLHKKKGKEFLGSFKIVKTVTKVNIEVLEASRYVELLARKKDLSGDYIPTEEFKLSQEELAKEMAFLDEHGVEGEFYLRAHKVISYTTTYKRKDVEEDVEEEVEKVVLMVPQFSGDANAFLGKCTFPEQALIMRNTIFATAGFHERHLIHLDIKPANLLILVNDDGIVEKCVLSDYGMSCKIPKGREKEMDRYYGTAHYAAPELILKEHENFIDVEAGNRYDFHTFERFDSFAVGVTLYETALGRAFWGLQYNYDDDTVITPEEDLRRNARESLKALDEKIQTTKNPAERDFLQVVRGLLEYDPAQRMSVLEAKERIIQLEGIYGKDALYPSSKSV